MLDDGITCPLQSRENADLWLDYAARRLSPPQARALDEHVAVCPSCQRFRQQQEMLWDTLDTWQSGNFQPGFALRLQERIEAEERRPAWERTATWFEDVKLKPALPVAAAILIIVLGLQFFQFFKSTKLTPEGAEPETVVETTEAAR